MGKASSAKKVARAARTGGKRHGRRRPATFPLVLTLIVVLGLALVVGASAASDQGFGGLFGESVDEETSPQPGEHWHASYGIFVCDRWIDPVADKGPDAAGIHTHEDGLIHIHPTATGAGKNATLNKFFDQVDLQVGDTELHLPDDRVFREGETECGGEPATVKVGYWKSAQDAATGKKPDEVFTQDIGDVRLRENSSAFTFAFVPKGKDIFPPLTAAEIEQLGAVDSGGAPGGVPGGAPGSIPGVPEDSAPPATGTP